LRSVRELGVHDPERGVKAVRRVITSPASSDERVLREAARFVERLFEHYRAMVPLSRAEEKPIRADVASRIMDIARVARGRNRLLAWRLSLRSLLLRWWRLGGA